MSYENLIREIRTGKREAEFAASLARREAIRSIPTLQKIERQIAQKATEYALEGLSEGPGLTEKQRANAERKYRREMEQLRRKRAEILTQNGLSEDSFAPRYRCARCSDTGFTEDGAMCACLKQRVIESRRGAYRLAHRLGRENFSTFDPGHFSQDKTISVQGKRISQAEAMLANKRTAERFAERFPHGESLLMFGNTGLGKTFLCNCIAKAIIDKGYTVVYHSAVELCRLFKDSSSFDRDDETERSYRDLFDADLLIIDDLGAERSTEFTVSELYGVVDTRLTTTRSTIVTSNLPIPDLREAYGDRIYSRFLKYIALKFYGEDTRGR